MPRKSMSLECWRPPDLPRWWRTPMMVLAGFGLLAVAPFMLVFDDVVNRWAGDLWPIVLLVTTLAGACIMWLCLRLTFSQPGGARGRLMISPHRLLVIDGRHPGLLVIDGRHPERIVQTRFVREVAMTQHDDDYWRVVLHPHQRGQRPVTLVIRTSPERAEALGQYLQEWVSPPHQQPSGNPARAD